MKWLGIGRCVGNWASPQESGVMWTPARPRAEVAGIPLPPHEEVRRGHSNHAKRKETKRKMKNASSSRRAGAVPLIFLFFVCVCSVCLSFSRCASVRVCLCVRACLRCPSRCCSSRRRGVVRPKLASVLPCRAGSCAVRLRHSVPEDRVQLREIKANAHARIRNKITTIVNCKAHAHAHAHTHVRAEVRSRLRRAPPTHPQMRSR